ncbi:MAG: hypothetical protein JNM84_08395 [Planctomycetes bacterium]|nr:hypothetical protein [Planctomycetota bacterium]
MTPPRSLRTPAFLHLALAATALSGAQSEARAQSLVALVADPTRCRSALVEVDSNGHLLRRSELSHAPALDPLGEGALHFELRSERTSGEFWVSTRTDLLQRCDGEGRLLDDCPPSAGQPRFSGLDDEPFYGLLAIEADGVLRASWRASTSCAATSWVLLLQAFPSTVRGAAADVAYLRGVRPGNVVALTSEGEAVQGSLARGYSGSFLVTAPPSEPPPQLPFRGLAFDPTREELLCGDTRGQVFAVDLTGAPRRRFQLPLQAGEVLLDLTLRPPAAEEIGTSCGLWCFPHLRTLGGVPARDNTSFRLLLEGLDPQSSVVYLIGAPGGPTPIAGLCGPLQLELRQPWALLGPYAATSGSIPGRCSGGHLFPLPIWSRDPWLQIDFHVQALALSSSGVELSNGLRLQVR